MITYGLFSNDEIHRTEDFGYDHFNLPSANISLQGHTIQCTRILKTSTIRIGTILTVKMNLSVLKLMYLSQFV